jgi:hypothetical protein
MPSAELLAAIDASAQSLLQATSSRVFLRQLREFTSAVARVPDHPAGTFSPVEIARVSSTCERVITSIERRLESSDDTAGVEQQLTEAIEEIKREMEEVSRWRRHFLQS